MSGAAGLQALVEAKSREIVEQNRQLVKTWGKYINAVDQLVFERDKRHLPEGLKSVIARCLENALVDASMRNSQRLLETTYQSNIAFLGIQLPVIAALIPSLALNELAIVQALDRRQGAVFYMDVQYGTNKGSVVAGTPMISAKTGHDRTLAGRLYAVGGITGEPLGVGDGATTTFVGGTLQAPVIDSTLVVTAGSIVGTAQAGGAITGTGIAAGSAVNLTTGSITVVFSAAPANGVPITVSYTGDMARSPTGVAEVNFNLTSENVSAQDFKLRSKYEMGAAIDLEKAHGIVFDDEMVKFLGAEIKFEIDHMGIDKIVTDSQNVAGGAAAQITPWAGNPGVNQEWVWKKYEFLDKIEVGNINIVQKTLRAYATFIVTGDSGARVMRQLKPDFVPEDIGSKAPAGPHKIGVLNGRPVIYDPFMADPTRYVMGFKGDSMLYGCFGYFPYIPLFSTPTIVTSDLIAQKGFMSAAGFKTLNLGMLTSGTISSLLP